MGKGGYAGTSDVGARHAVAIVAVGTSKTSTKAVSSGVVGMTGLGEG